MRKHLYASIADHGLGHLSQSSAVINQLHQMAPNISITVQCGLDYQNLRLWLKCPFTHQQHSTEFGMLMDNAVDVQREASLQCYKIFHEQWQYHLEQEKKRLISAKPDLIFANISYLTLAAAQQLNIPNIAMCSLNWSEILEGYADQATLEICQQINEIYRNATTFLQPQPHMAMENLPNTHSISPLARIGNNKNRELKQRLQLSEDSTLLLIGMGGIPTQLPIEQWPVEPNIYYLIPDDWPQSHPNTLPFRTSKLSFIDMLCSCDALITKPGYGSFSESACNGIPILYLPRNDWPEEPFLIDWLHQHGSCYELSRKDFFSGKFKKALLHLKLPQRKPNASGAIEAAEILLSYL